MSDVYDSWPQTRGHDLLRAYSDTVNTALLTHWLPRSRLGRVLKTDAFDEATGAGVYPLLQKRADEVVAIDVAPKVLAAATARYPSLQTRNGDVRHLEFPDESFDVVVSLSTLDHLQSHAEVTHALREVSRVLRPGGTLVVTLDNPHNPLVQIRSRLPFGALRRLRLVQYPFGATHGLRGLQALAQSAGLSTTGTATVMHVPRVFALALAVAVPRRPLLASLRACERLGGLPTRSVTGQFVAVRANKP